MLNYYYFDKGERGVSWDTFYFSRPLGNETENLNYRYTTRTRGSENGWKIKIKTHFLQVLYKTE